MTALSSLPVLLCALVLSPQVLAIGQTSCVAFNESPSTIPVVKNGQASPILLSEDDWPGVHRTAHDFASDIERVTGIKPNALNITAANASFSRPIIVGTLGKSSLIDEVVNNTGLDVSDIRGHWEAFVAKEVENPLPGVDSAYVIIGSDKRGTIYALYEHSEQFGVSPWYWWADVVSKQHAELHVEKTGCSHGTPTVKYRGIFLNDEEPALGSWAKEKFTNGTGAALTGSPFNHHFYSHVFELMLRLKANYLWPAMWGSAFGIDDELNQAIADWYGIAMGTSHQEPMMRSSPNEFGLFGTGPWNYTSNPEVIYEYWVNGTQRSKNYESVYTLGMRGAGDLPMEESTNIALLEKVISDQRQILIDVYNGTDITSIPQIWTLYKEVEGYYEGGLTVPDDVTLLWADDNWGNVRRYPLVDERNRTGGAGVYYHFDFVGDPRSYKWITTTQISKVYEQMSLALDRSADRLWIVNVGDLKPFEREIEFFISYGYDSSRWNAGNLNEFVTSWAQRDFDLSLSDATVVSDIVHNLTQWNARRKPELLNSTTYSLYNYREAETVVSAWQTLEEKSAEIYNGLSRERQPSFFQLVLHPVLASANLAYTLVYAGLNNLRASQARLSTNHLADQVLEHFDKDYDLEVAYHSLLDGKWNHIMDQTHIGYYYWQQPMVNTMPAIVRVQGRKQALAGVMRIALEGTPGAWPGDNPNQCDIGYNCPPPTLTLDSFDTFGNRYIDVGAGGPNSFDFKVSANVSWLQFSAEGGLVSPEDPEQRVYVSVGDWDAIDGNATAAILFNSTSKGQNDLSVSIIFVAHNTKASLSTDFKGFVEGAGFVSIEAAHATRNSSVEGVAWQEIPGLGRTFSAVTPWPRTDANYSAGSGPSLEYDFFNFNTIDGSGNVTVTTYASPSLNANGRDRPLGLAIQLDSSDLQSSYFIPLAEPGELPREWGGPDGFVANSIVSIPLTFTGVDPGAHSLKLFALEPEVHFADTGGLVASYLGPPESVIV